MAFDYKEGVPKGRIIPMYLSDDGDLYPMFLHSEEELDMLQAMVGIFMDHTVVIDTKHPINDPKDKLCVYNLNTRKIK